MAVTAPRGSSREITCSLTPVSSSLGSGTTSRISRTVSAPFAGMSSPRCCAEPTTTSDFCSCVSSDASRGMTLSVVIVSVYGISMEYRTRCDFAERRCRVYCGT